MKRSKLFSKARGQFLGVISVIVSLGGIALGQMPVLCQENIRRWGEDQACFRGVDGR